VREERPPFSPADVVAEFARLLKTYRVGSVVGDRYAGEWPRERFREHGVDYEPAEKTRSELYGELLPLLNSGSVELLDHPRLIAQLCDLERRTGRSGRDSIDHSPRGHDDLINAAAGAIVECRSATSRELVLGSVPLGPSRPMNGIANPFHPAYSARPLRLRRWGHHP
jgi:hypothetical protein